MKQLLFTLLLLPLFSHAQLHRNYDGVGNNSANPNWGAAEGNFNWLTPNAYEDGESAPSGENRPNARIISNALSDQDQFIPNEKGLSDFIWGWGQFIDHDINLNDDHPTEILPISVPIGDPEFDPGFTGTVQIPMKRSVYDPTTGTGGNFRVFINSITAFIDGSGVYGVDEDRANWLRTFQNGKLKVSSNNLLPFNTLDLEREGNTDNNAPFMLIEPPGSLPYFYIGGDVRINEQPGLTCFHTLFVREHNRLCDEILLENPMWTDEQIFQWARKKVGAIIQAITYEEFLPSIGVELSAPSGYDPNINANIFNVFSAAAYRFGHTMITGRLLRLEESGDTLNFGSLDLRDGFFKPDLLVDENGIEPFFRGMAVQEHQKVDLQVMNDLRNFLFGPPGAGGIDLIATNINRGRDRGLADYNTIRQSFGLDAISNFNQISSNPDVAFDLSTTYDDVNEIDPWIGMMAEDHLPGKIIGPTLNAVFIAQFEALRDGDWYYYEYDPAFSPEEIATLKNTKLSEVILRNTSITNIQENVFVAEPRALVGVEIVPFKNIRNIEIEAFPNPVQKHFTLSVESIKDEEGDLYVLDQLGRTILQRSIQLNRGENSFSLSLEDEIANGIYSILLKTNDDAGQIKIVKHK